MINFNPDGLIISILTTLGFDITSLKIDSPESMFAFGMACLIGLFFIIAVVFALFRFLSSLFKGARL